MRRTRIRVLRELGAESFSAGAGLRASPPKASRRSATASALCRLPARDACCRTSMPCSPRRSCSAVSCRTRSSAIDAGLTIAHITGECWWVPELWRLKAELCVARAEDPTSSAQHLRTAFDLAQTLPKQATDAAIRNPALPARGQLIGTCGSEGHARYVVSRAHRQRGHVGPHRRTSCVAAGELMRPLEGF